MKYIQFTAIKLFYLGLFMLILFTITPFVTYNKLDDWFSVFGTSFALFTELICLGILFMNYRFNHNLLQLMWVFITCTTFFFYFISDFLWSTFGLSKLNNGTVVLFEVFVSITEGILLYFLLKFKPVKNLEKRSINIAKTTLFSFIFNTISTLAGYFVSPIFIKMGLKLFSS